MCSFRLIFTLSIVNNFILGVPKKSFYATHLNTHILFTLSTFSNLISFCTSIFLIYTKSYQQIFLSYFRFPQEIFFTRPENFLFFCQVAEQVEPTILWSTFPPGSPKLWTWFFCEKKLQNVKRNHGSALTEFYDFPGSGATISFIVLLAKRPQIFRSKHFYISQSIICRFSLAQK